MVKNKKVILITVLLTNCLYIFNLICKSASIENKSSSINDIVKIKELTFGECDFILKVGYSDLSYSTINSDGNEISDGNIKNFFIGNQDVTDTYSNHFAQLKKYYVSMSQDSNNAITHKIVITKNDASYFFCSYFYERDGHKIDYLYYGKHKGSIKNQIPHSFKGASPSYNLAISYFYSPFTANIYDNQQYHQTDYYNVAFTAQIMFMCYYKTSNSGIIFAYYTSSSAIRNGEVKETQFFVIEDIIGNGAKYVDGITFRGGSSLDVCIVSNSNKISQYTDKIITDQLSLTNNSSSRNCISEMHYVSRKPTLSIFSRKLDKCSSTYNCNQFSCSNNPNYATTFFWGLYASKEIEELFKLYCNYSFYDSNELLGSRLHTKIG